MKLDQTYWDKRYIEMKTRWDVGSPTKPLKEYINQLKNKDARILIPGSGNGYEAEYLFKRQFHNTFVLDYSKTALNNFINRVPDFPNDQILEMNFFNLAGKFDIIIEQTFFCAIEIDQRHAYINKMSELLDRKGKLIGLFFDDIFNNQKPPFGASKNQYLKLLNSLFKISTFEECYNSIPSREGSEFFCIAEKI
mgnify:CR=1 FL=1|tara:strand:+ start:720 stop:1301 length:582 start_codon:yes stop_codon:yes gene_type:complete